jgi:hypothetical protein
MWTPFGINVMSSVRTLPLDARVERGAPDRGTAVATKPRAASAVRVAAWATTLASCAIVLGLSFNRFWGSDIYALAASIQDDSFYYLLPAHHFRETGFFTFDGHTRTYGFQPLYMLVLTGVALLTPDLEALLRVALILNVALYCATALAIFGIISASLRRASAPMQTGAALVGAHLFLCNIGVFLANSTAKENALAGFLLACGVLICIRTRAADRERNQALRRESGVACGVGLIIGLLVLCRLLPTTLFSAGLLLCGARLSIRNRALSVAAALLPIVAWAVYASVAFGRVMPTSGSVKGGSLEDTAAVFSDDQGRSGMLRQSAAYVGNGLLFAIGGFHEFWMPQPDAWGLGGRGPNSAWLFRILMDIVLILALSGVVIFGARVIGSAGGGWLLLLLFVLNLLGAAVTALALHRQTEGLFYFSWYLYDLPISISVLLSLLCAAAAGRIGDAVRRGRSAIARAAPFLVGAACLACLACTIAVYRPMRRLPAFSVHRDNWQSLMIHCGRVLRDEIGLRPGERVAAYSCGALGFVLNGAVTNMDGLANDEIVAFREGGGSWQDYFDRSSIAYYVDVMDPAILDVAHNILRKEPFESGRFPFYYIVRIQPKSGRD